RHPGHRPDRLEVGARALIAQIDDDRFERRVVLIKGNQHFPAERRQGMKIELQGHRERLFVQSTCAGPTGHSLSPPWQGLTLPSSMDGRLKGGHGDYELISQPSSRYLKSAT